MKYGFIKKTFLIRLLFWFRGFLSENKIPRDLFYRLKGYVPELSKPIPDLEVINELLEHDIAYLNTTKALDSSRKVTGINITGVKIVGYQDVIELDAFMDRVWILDIDMVDSSDFARMYRKMKDSRKLYYRLRLSSLKSHFTIKSECRQEYDVTC
jgi:hypothetical protein